MTLQLNEHEKPLRVPPLSYGTRTLHNIAFKRPVFLLLHLIIMGFNWQASKNPSTITPSNGNLRPSVIDKN